MTPTHPRPPAGRTRWFRALAALAAAALAATLGGPAPVAASPLPPVLTNPPASPGAGAAGATHTVTLLTGDVALLHVAPDGSQAAWLTEPATDSSPPPQIVELDGEISVIPAEAAPYLDAGVLDPRLFNVSQLVAHGYDDTSREDLPLLLQTPPAAAQSAVELPDAARETRRLDSVGAVAVSAEKSGMRSVWESLRGPDPAEPGAAGAELAGAGQVWLNGTVVATLGDSVGHVGAPTAWDTGYDGSGVRVAVLDTGYDPDHPDLAGRVAGARDFTGDQPTATAVDGNGHGTHVAATVAGTGAASDGTRRGVAPGADLLIGKVLDDHGSGLEDWVIAGMEWAVAQGSQVVNMSLGTPWASDGNDPLSSAVNRLTEQSGALFVIAAGNSGPGEQTVSSPGAADLALTVGASTYDDQPAWFSSRGPRFGDEAIKPEIVAPGVGIVAARAAGTSLGNLVDDHYTSLNGTSMAAPHVAGAAAILAQQHPELDAGGLKALLVSTSQRLDEPVSFQGAGRLDLAAAVTTQLTVDYGALSFGRVENTGTLTRTLTYQNHSEQPVTLRLSAGIAATGTSSHKPVLRLRPTALVIPPGEQASAQVELSAHATRPGSYAGHITARDARSNSAELHTVLSATVEAPIRTVTVTAVNRDGGPATGPVQLWNAGTGQLAFGHLNGGTAVIQVPEGQYTLVTVLNTTDGSFPPASVTVAAEPELTVRRDLDLHFDAREGEPVRVVTPQATELDSFRVLWHRQVGARSVASAAAQGVAGTELYLLASPRARTGEFEVSVNWREAQPLLTADLVGPDGFRIAPSPALASGPNAYAGQATLPVVYAGHGTPEEFADVDVDGKVVLLTRDGFGQLHAQADAAATAGAALVLVHNDQTGGWLESVSNGPLPVYRIDRGSGLAIRAAIDNHPEPELALSGVIDASYSYEVGFVESGAIPAGRTYRVEDQPMAVVESDYRRNSARMDRSEWWIPYLGSSDFAAGSSLPRNGPVVRTEYVSTDNVRWQRFAQPHGEFANVYWTWSAIEQYVPDQDYHQVWWGPLTRPGVPAIAGSEELGTPVARFHDAIRIGMVHYLYGGGHAYGTIWNQLGDTSTLTLRRGGELVGSWSWSEAQVTVPAAEDDFELSLRVDNGSGNFMDTSVGSESTWRFRSGRPAGGYQVLPLVHLDYQLAADADNRVPAGTPYPLGIEPGYQPGADGPAEFAVQVEVSYDDGESWLTTPVAPAGGRFEATVPAATAGAEFASVRVVATDAAGNSLTQLIERAWRVGSD